jgi:hypothetical protein
VLLELLKTAVSLKAGTPLLQFAESFHVPLTPPLHVTTAAEAGAA